jgi:uncharacterized protein GlcG (DUF336 family)
LAIGVALVLAAGSAGAQAPPPPPAYGPPITLEQAKKVMAGAEAEAKKNNWGMAIMILDSGGSLVMMQRLDGTQLGSIDVARDKAWSAVAFRRPTKVFEDLVSQGGPNLRLLRLTGASPIEGGIPIVVDGKIVGAVGVSGGTAPQDGQVAKVGVDALK